MPWLARQGDERESLSSRQTHQIRHDRAACPRHAGLVLLRTIGGALVQPIGQPIVRAEFRDEPRDVVAPVPAACRALTAQHEELADQSADRSIAGHVRSLGRMGAVVANSVWGSGRSWVVDGG